MKKILDILRLLPVILLRAAHVIKHLYCDMEDEENEES